MAGVISSFYDQIYHHKSGVNYVELTVGTIPVVYSICHAADNASKIHENSSKTDSVFGFDSETI